MWRSCHYLSNILFAHSITYFPNHYREGFIATRQRYCMSEHLAPTPRWRLETWIQRLPVPDMLFPETTLRTFQLDVLRFSDLLFWAQPWADHICQIGASLGMQPWSSQCATYSGSSSPPKWDSDELVDDNLFWSVDTCQSWARAPSKAPVVSLTKKLYYNCLVLVGSMNGLERNLHKQNIACFTIELKLV